MPDVLGDEVGDDRCHADEHAAVVEKAEPPHRAVRHPGRRHVVELNLGLVRTRRLALGREEVFGVGVEEALQRGDVGRVEDAHARAPLRCQRAITRHARATLSAGADRAHRAIRRRAG
jgi:hypothetical protein